MTRTTIKPLIIKYDCPSFAPYNSVIDDLSVIVMFMTNFRITTIEIIELPEF